MSNHATRSEGPVLVVVEGLHDIAILRGLSRVLHLHDNDLPDLAEWEVAGQVVFVPSGGGDLKSWAIRLARLRLPQFLLFDRELPPESATREQTVEWVNLLPGTVACLTVKRAMENYLHPQAILEATGVQGDFDDWADVPQVMAEKVLALTGGPAWETLSRRGRNCLRNWIKRVLNHSCVGKMTASLLAARDPQGEVAGWLRTIRRLWTGA